MRRSVLTRTRIALGAIALAALALVAYGGLTGVFAPRLAVSLAAVTRGANAYAFNPDPLVVPARTTVRLTFDNQSDAPHTLILLTPVQVASNAAIAGGERASLDFTTPDAGTYRFVCNVHEGMAGTLIVR